MKAIVLTGEQRTKTFAKEGEHGNICAGAWGMAWGLVLAEGHPLLRSCWP